MSSSFIDKESFTDIISILLVIFIAFVFFPITFVLLLIAITSYIGYNISKGITYIFNRNLKKVYTFEEFEYINDQLKTRTIQLNGKPVNLFEYKNGKLIPMPQTPYAREKVVAEIVGQLRNWNIETHQNGGVTSSQGGFDFNVGGQRTIRAPDVSFTPKQTDRGLNALQNWTFQGQPFTPIFVVEVDFIESEAQFQVFDDRFRNEIFAQGTSVELGFLVSIGQDNNGQLAGTIHSWRWYENSNAVRHYEHGWRNMDTRVGGREILPGFELNVRMIEESISQQDSGSSSSDDDNTSFSCPKCTKTFTNNHRFMKHFQMEHALKRRT
ncbi:unnamed protein product [Rhizophagus irregularis]|nr:unnamed protein product [Rhizophagus irregularis]CAB4425037.1 unnamed protein product [Rhizophagus irregularis]CAB5211589.1 unnamed protein product [Rhizophagus irregularis]